MMRILLVDDHAIVRAGIRRLLEDEFRGVTIDEAASAEEAARAISANAPDLVILDISLGGGRSGLDLLPEIAPRSRVVVLSSFGDPQFAVRSIRDGASAFLTKERAPRELIEAVRTVLGGRRFIGAELAEQLAALVASDHARPHESLSAREFEVFRLIASAKSVSDIAVELGLSVKTVSTYRARILEKMGMSSNAELMQYALRNGLVV
jgi:DNA-binding NarL/FixJ family response regulator